MQSFNIFGVRVDKVTLDQAIDQIEEWIKKGGKHYVVTTNIEFIMLAQEDKYFKNILNGSDLSIPDSARLNWAYKMTQSDYIKRLLYWPLFFLPSVKILPAFPVVTGVELMEELIKLANKKGFTIGLLGGKNNVAERLAECLKRKYPNLRIVFTDSSMVVDKTGDIVEWDNGKDSRFANGSRLHSTLPLDDTGFIALSEIPNIDILFVAFGHGKQEKWIYKNLQKVNAKVMMGVGGSFDYLAGEVPRAPKIIRELGFEWLFRLLVQPWRIKRFGSLVEFVFRVLVTNRTSHL